VFPDGPIETVRFGALRRSFLALQRGIVLHPAGLSLYTKILKNTSNPEQAVTFLKAL
jgi:hypothetical protein